MAMKETNKQWNRTELNTPSPHTHTPGIQRAFMITQWDKIQYLGNDVGKFG